MAIDRCLADLPAVGGRGCELLIAANGRMTSYLAAVQARAIARLNNGTGYTTEQGLVIELGRDQTVGSVTCALNLPPQVAGQVVAAATELVTTYPTTLAAMQDGRIDPGRAKAISEELTRNDLTADVREQIEDEAVAYATDRTAPLTRRMVRRRVDRADPGAADRRHRHRITERGVRARDQDDGIGSLYWDDAADRTRTAYHRIDIQARANHAAAKADPKDSRTLAQPRADVLHHLLNDPHQGPHPDWAPAPDISNGPDGGGPGGGSDGGGADGGGPDGGGHGDSCPDGAGPGGAEAAAGSSRAPGADKAASHGWPEPDWASLSPNTATRHESPVSPVSPAEYDSGRSDQDSHVNRPPHSEDSDKAELVHDPEGAPAAKPAALAPRHQDPSRPRPLDPCRPPPASHHTAATESAHPAGIEGWHTFATMRTVLPTGRNAYLHVHLDLPTYLHQASHRGHLQGHGDLPGCLTADIAATAATVQITVTHPATGSTLHAGPITRNRPVPAATRTETTETAQTGGTEQLCETPWRSAHLLLHIDLPTLLALAGDPDRPPALTAAITRTLTTLPADPAPGICLHENAVARHDPPESMSDLVHAQHRTCRFKNCRRPARQCDLDHRVDHPQGKTCSCNLQPLCRRHHNLKTHGGWRVHPQDPTRPTGDLVWTSPHGNQYVDHPEPPPSTRSRHAPSGPDVGMSPLLATAQATRMRSGSDRTGTGTGKRRASRSYSGTHTGTAGTGPPVPVARGRVAPRAATTAPTWHGDGSGRGG